jgi:hypothetical protein
MLKKSYLNSLIALYILGLIGDLAAYLIFINSLALYAAYIR